MLRPSALAHGLDPNTESMSAVKVASAAARNLFAIGLITLVGDREKLIVKNASSAWFPHYQAVVALRLCSGHGGYTSITREGPMVLREVFVTCADRQSERIRSATYGIACPAMMPVTSSSSTANLPFTNTNGTPSG